MENKKFYSENVSEEANSSNFGKLLHEIKTDKTNRNVCLAIVGCLIAFIILIIIFATGRKTINLTDYISAEATGIDGYGSVQVTIHKEKLYEDVFGVAPADTIENAMELIQYDDKCTLLSNSIYIADIKNDGKLSNGDTALIEVVFKSADYDFGQTIKGGTFEYNISGLEKGTVVDPFSDEYVDISFEGINGSGTVTIEKKTEENWIYGTTYTIDKTENLRNGDEITITAEMADSYDTYLEELMEGGKYIQQVTTIKKKVTNLKNLASVKDIDDEYINKAIEKATAKANELYTQDGEYRNIKLVGVVFEDKIDKTSAKGDMSILKGNPRYSNLTIYFEYEMKLFMSWNTRNLEYSFIDIEIDENGNLSELKEPIASVYLYYDGTMWEHDEDFELTKLN